MDDLQVWFVIDSYLLVTFIGSKKGLRIISPITYKQPISPGSASTFSSVNWETTQFLKSFIMKNQYLINAEEVDNEPIEACNEGDSGSLLSLIRYYFF
ncbi:hypothetical protein M1146_04075 [Patescibacteria group bacterium]|nr:hypothetical protein [Patescibacteria group bacterium]